MNKDRVHRELSKVESELHNCQYCSSSPSIEMTGYFGKSLHIKCKKCGASGPEYSIKDIYAMVNAGANLPVDINVGPDGEFSNTDMFICRAVLAANAWNKHN
jgi:hypothetical protein